jgi:hypothetical protein
LVNLSPSQLANDLPVGEYTIQAALPLGVRQANLTSDDIVALGWVIGHHPSE